MAVGAGSSAHASTGGSASARGVNINLLGVPLLGFPGISVPGPTTSAPATNGTNRNAVIPTVPAGVTIGAVNDQATRAATSVSASSEVTNIGITVLTLKLVEADRLYSRVKCPVQGFGNIEAEAAASGLKILGREVDLGLEDQTINVGIIQAKVKKEVTTTATGATAFSLRLTATISVGITSVNLGTIDLAQSTCSRPTAADPAPTASGINPDSGPVAGGNTVTVTGSNFAPGETSMQVVLPGRGIVTIPANQVTVSADGKTASFAMPNGRTPGAATVTAITPSGQAAPLNYTYLAAPTTSGLSPNIGPVAGGQTVTVTGENFVPGQTSVEMVLPGGGTTTIPASQVQVAPDGKSLTFTTPPGGQPGGATVAVKTPGGTSPTQNYTYVAVPSVTGLSPDSGPVEGGTAVTVSGSGFVAGQTTVTMTLPNGEKVTIPANEVTVNPDGTLRFTTPPGGQAGPATVEVTTPGGTSPPQTFTYRAAPTAASVDPAAGPVAGGNTVTVSGTEFVPGQTTVEVTRPDGQKVTVPANQVTVTPDGKSLTFTMPPGVEPGAASIVVGTPGGTAPPLPYRYEPAPVASSITPNSGPVEGGNTVTVAGTDFKPGATTVEVTLPNGDKETIPANEVTVSPDGTSLTFAMPPGGEPGAASVVVSTIGGSSAPLPYTYRPEPTAGSVSPNEGPLAGGNTVTVSGTGFVPGETTVEVTLPNGEKVTIPANQVTVGPDGTSLTVTMPPGVEDGEATIVVATPGGTTLPLTYNYRPEPTAGAVEPKSGPVAGGNEITVSGTGFVPGSTTVEVTLPNGEKVTIPANEVTVSPDGTSLTFTAPPGVEAGEASIAVTTPGGTTAPLPYNYRPEPTAGAVDPNEGPLAGGNTVKVSGTGFVPGETTVEVTLPNGEKVTIPANQVTVGPDGTSLKVTMPPGVEAGAASIVVATPGGRTEPLPYTYQPAPEASSLAPDRGPIAGGDKVTIAGSNFKPGATTVEVTLRNGDKVTIPAKEVTVNPDGTSLTFSTPPGGEAGAAQVTVVTVGGRSEPLTFTYLPVPTLGSVNPNSGPLAGGNTVTVSGTGFVPGATSVEVTLPNGEEVTIPAERVTVNPDGTLTFIMPPGIEEGVAQIAVTTPGGTSAPLPYTYRPEPTAGAVDPDSGPQAGGNQVTVSGTGLVPGETSVTVTLPNGEKVVIPANQVTVNPEGTTATFIMPPSAQPGAATITLTTPGGTTGPITYTYTAPPGNGGGDPGNGGGSGGGGGSGSGGSGGTLPGTGSDLPSPLIVGVLLLLGSALVALGRKRSID